LLRPLKSWGTTSYASISIGQEVGVTPLQLVSMVSTIANGGVYLPPHVLMPGQVGNGPHSDAPQRPEPLKLGEDLPDPLPPGAHRVISTMTAAQMRKMMEGVVLFGTGKKAQLNGYSSGGKTGTAQKIDPVTHLYSKTMHIASFAGIAPVNNPVIAVAVIIDNPKGASYYGAAVSAPVFAEVAQQVLEYLGVPHDTEVQAPRTKTQPLPTIAEDDDQQQGDVNAVFAAINDLPSDDPLRTPPQQPAAQPPAAQASTQNAPATPDSGAPASKAATQPAQKPQSQPSSSQPVTATVAVSDKKQLKVPSFIGLPVRKVIEQAYAAGLDVHITGEGFVREQAPAAGTMVAPGTRIVVHCTR
jgi:cell division protein FtsI (penicillin-binding protein 3)